jgi:hypothetical protein
LNILRKSHARVDHGRTGLHRLHERGIDIVHVQMHGERRSAERVRP